MHHSSVNRFAFTYFPIDNMLSLSVSAADAVLLFTADEGLVIVLIGSRVSLIMAIICSSHR